MAKTQEELTQLKNEVEIMNKKLSELTDEELSMVVGGYTTKTLYTFEMGECYSDVTNIYKVLHYHKDLNINDDVDCCWFDKHSWIANNKKQIVHENQKIKVNNLINANYEGMNII